MNDADPKLKKHEFDGIQEYDHPVPLWLNLILWGSIVFSLIYFPYYHFFGGTLPREAYEQEMAAVRAEQAAQKAAAPELDLEALATNEEAAAAGREVFNTYCASCHGMQAEGLVGPSFQDTAWRQGDGSLASIIEIATDGVPAKGMPPWGHLGEKTIHQVAAYIYHISTPEGKGEPHPDFAREVP